MIRGAGCRLLAESFFCSSKRWGFPASIALIEPTAKSLQTMFVYADS
jgi:hypothetical protein